MRRGFGASKGFNRAMDLWEWITTTTPASSVFTTFGLGVLAVLFATDRILTKGQHTRRAADLVAFHERELIEKDQRIADMKESRNGWREVALREREIRETVTKALVESSTDALIDVKHVLESLDKAIPNPRGGES